MASSSSCEYCGATLRSDEQQCSNCGAPNPGYVPPKQHNNEKPRTIEELQAFCAERGMPLQKMASTGRATSSSYTRTNPTAAGPSATGGRTRPTP